MAFGSFEVHAGDFKKSNDHQILDGRPGFLLMKSEGKFLREKIFVTEVVESEMTSEENVKHFGGTIGWGAVGGMLLGPVRLLAGLLAEGRGKDVTFVCKLKYGRKFMATAPSMFTRSCPRRSSSEL